MIAPKLPSFFKAHQAKQFEFRPRYYDEKREMRKNRENRIRQEVENEVKAHDPEVFRNRLRERWSQKSKVRKGNYSSLLRLVLIIALLAYISYYVLQ